MNQTNFFLKLEYSTKPPEDSSADPNESKFKHTKLIGFIESRIKVLL